MNPATFCLTGSVQHDRTAGGEVEVKVCIQHLGSKVGSSNVYIICTKKVPGTIEIFLLCSVWWCATS